MGVAATLPGFSEWALMRMQCMEVLIALGNIISALGVS